MQSMHLSLASFGRQRTAPRPSDHDQVRHDGYVQHVRMYHGHDRGALR